ncbi:MAG: hypothetical protein OQL20_06930 [Sedimenticola sp.]|nr:hypothetical protein [Sedimenticola sp.]
MIMNPLYRLLLLLWLSLMSLSLLAGSPPHDLSDTPNQTEASDSQNVWDKTKRLGATAVQSGKALGSATLDKTADWYQAAKEKGQQTSAIITEKSRAAWHETKRMGATAAKKGREWRAAVAEKSRSLYHQATQPEKQPQTAQPDKNS